MSPHQDRNGFLNKDQLTDALHVLNIPASDDDLELLYTRMSRSNPDGVSYDDFCEMLDFRSKNIQSEFLSRKKFFFFCLFCFVHFFPLLFFFKKNSELPAYSFHTQQACPPAPLRATRT